MVGRDSNVARPAPAESSQAANSIDFNDIFSLRRPKDFKAGLASGAKSVAKGFLGGTVALFAAPAAGAVQEGPIGFGKGLAAGLVGAVALPVIGITVGTAQIVRGAVAQPSALTQEAAGKQWDLRMREWINNPGSALTLDDPTREAARQRWEGVHRAATRLSHDDDFYALLGVQRDATPAHIKKQYYTLARSVHPDKNPDDPAAKARFQRLGEAYQVLSDPARRKRYDTSGMKGLEDTELMDGALFFASLFGSEGFHHLIGDLMIATVAREGGLDTTSLQTAQVARVAELVIMLTALLRRWVEGDEHGFTEAMTAEATVLVDLSFGALLLETIGYAYRLQAELYLGDFLGRSVLNFRSTGHAVSAKLDVAKCALKVFKAQQKIQQLEARREEQLAEGERVKAQENASGDPAAPERVTGDSATSSSQPPHNAPPCADRLHVPQAQGSSPPSAAGLPPHQAASTAAALAYQEERAAAEDAALPLMLRAMWSANVVDIESTIGRVCSAVLHDSKASAEVKRKRAEGLRELSRIFCQMKPKEQQSFQDGPSAKAAMEAAMMSIVQKKFAEDDALHKST